MQEVNLNEKIHYKIIFDTDKSFATIRTLEGLTFDNYQLILRELIAAPEWRAGMNVIVDHRASSIDGLTLYDLQNISFSVKQIKDNLGHGGHCAIVLSDDADFTKIAMWKLMTEPIVGFKIDYFDSIEAAKEWFYKN